MNINWATLSNFFDNKSEGFVTIEAGAVGASMKALVREGGKPRFSVFKIGVKRHKNRLNARKFGRKVQKFI